MGSYPPVRWVARQTKCVVKIIYISTHIRMPLYIYTYICTHVLIWGSGFMVRDLGFGSWSAFEV